MRQEKSKKGQESDECAFHCGKKVVPGRRLCETHLRQERDKIRKYRADRKEKGLCWRCNRPARPGGVLCDFHRSKVRVAERKVREENRKKKLAKAGVS